MNTQNIIGFIECAQVYYEREILTLPKDCNFDFAVKEADRSFTIEWSCDNIRDFNPGWYGSSDPGCPDPQQVTGSFTWLKAERLDKLAEYCEDMFAEICEYGSVEDKYIAVFP